MGSIPDTDRLDTDRATVRDAAAPVTTGQLATDLDRSQSQIAAALADLAERGEVRLDEHGAVSGAGGLSVHPDRHEIELDGRRFWTRCAYDILGIFAALGASGSAVSPSPGRDEPIRLTFHAGRPDPADAVLFRPDESLADRCANPYEQWCPNSNLFPTPEVATAWAQANHLTGAVLDLDTAAEQGGAAWRPLVAVKRGRRERE